MKFDCLGPYISTPPERVPERGQNLRLSKVLPMGIKSASKLTVEQHLNIRLIQLRTEPINTGNRVQSRKVQQGLQRPAQRTSRPNEIDRGSLMNAATSAPSRVFLYPPQKLYCGQPSSLETRGWSLFDRRGVRRLCFPGSVAGLLQPQLRLNSAHPASSSA